MKNENDKSIKKTKVQTKAVHDRQKVNIDVPIQVETKAVLWALNLTCQLNAYHFVKALNKLNYL